MSVPRKFQIKEDYQFIVAISDIYRVKIELRFVINCWNILIFPSSLKSSPWLCTEIRT